MIERIKYLYRALRFKYKIDPDEINYIISHLQEGDIAVDLGAHKGGYLYWMRKSVTKKGKVYGFEPQVKLFNYLKKIVALSHYTNVTLENFGASSKEGEVDFFIPRTRKGDSPGAKIDSLANCKNYKKAKIKITTLDNYFFNRKIFPNLIKIDVEGHEKQVLLGGLNLFKKHKPRIIMECENRHIQEGDIFDVFNILLDIGYKGYYFEDKELKAIENFSISTNQINGTGQFWEANGYINNFIFE